MNVYEDFRRKIAGPTIPLPIIFRKDLSIDHSGIERFVTWLLDGGFANICLTYGYSQIGSLTPTEVMDVTRTIASVVGNRAVFISCTSGNSAMETVTAVREMHKLGAHAAFVMPNLMHYSGADYRAFLRYIAGESDLPILFVSYPAPGSPGTPNLNINDYKLLLEHENIVGLKEDYNSITYRMELIRNFGDRLCIIGGGLQRNYLFFHRYPHQGELDSGFNPGLTMRFYRLLDENRLAEVLELIDEQERIYLNSPSGLHWISQLNVCMQVLGFAETWQTRPPVIPATEEQAQAVIAWMHQHPDYFEFQREIGRKQM